MRRSLMGLIGLLCLVAPVVGVDGGAPSVSAAPTVRRAKGNPFTLMLRTSAASTKQNSLDPLGIGSTRKDFKPQNLPSRGDPMSMVTAIVTVSADSIASAKQKATAAGLPFDEGAAAATAAAANAAAAAGLRSQGFTVTHQFTRVLNAVVIRGRLKDMQRASGAPGFARLTVSQRIERDNLNSNNATAVAQAWEAAGLTGTGTTLGIIDTGIDYTHADFGGSGDLNAYLNNDGNVVEPGTFPTAKVVGGYDFVGDGWPVTSDTPIPDDDPLDCDGHGTHTAGTAAGMGVLADGSTYHGPYTQEAVDSQKWNVGPGVAPDASIRAYKVFSCFGFTSDDIIIAAIERAAADHVDVISMSLGSPEGGASGPVADAVSNAAQLGVLTVVAAGNDSQIPYSVSSPSTSNEALSVAAYDAFPGFNVTTRPVSVSGDVNMQSANYNLYPYPNGPVTGSVGHVADACAPDAFAGTAGQVVVAPVDIFTCDFTNFSNNVDLAPSAALVIVNDLIAGESNFEFGNLPIITVSEADAALFSDGMSVTLTAEPTTTTFVPNTNVGHTANFTSGGFRFGDSALKPDVAAPGVGVTSAWMGSGNAGFAASGTSMATPHVAGIALLVRQAHPAWTPGAVKGAIMSTADPSAIIGHDVSTSGTGLVSASRAVGTLQWFSTRDGLNNLSFGFNEIAGPFKASRTITLNNASKSAITYDLSTQVKSIPGVTGLRVTPTPKSVRVAANSSVTVTVTLSLADPQHLPSTTVLERYDCTLSDGGSPPFGGECGWIRGTLVATPRTAGVSTLRAGIGMVPTGLSNVKAAPRDGEMAPTASAATRVTNAGVHAATADVLQWLATDTTGDSPDPTTPDIRDVGVAVVDGVDPVPVYGDIDFDGDGIVDCAHCIVDYTMVPGKELKFTFADQAGSSTNWMTDHEVQFDVNHDGTPDAFLDLTGPYAAFSSADFQEFWFNESDWRNNDSLVSGNVSVGFIERVQQRLGVSGAYDVSFASFGSQSFLNSDSVASVAFDHHKLAVNTSVGLALAPGASTLIKNTVDKLTATAQKTLGWLVVSLDDAAGPASADRVPLRLRPGN